MTGLLNRLWITLFSFGFVRYIPDEFGHLPVDKLWINEKGS